MMIALSSIKLKYRSEYHNNQCKLKREMDYLGLKGVGYRAIACYCCKPYFFRSLSIPETLKNIYIFTQYCRNNENIENL